jgi:hypothetical protein
LKALTSIFLYTGQINNSSHGTLPRLIAQHQKAETTSAKHRPDVRLPLRRNMSWEVQVTKMHGLSQMVYQLTQSRWRKLRTFLAFAGYEGVQNSLRMRSKTINQLCRKNTRHWKIITLKGKTHLETGDCVLPGFMTRGSYGICVWSIKIMFMLNVNLAMYSHMFVWIPHHFLAGRRQRLC